MYIDTFMNDSQDNISKAIAQRVKERRLELNLTQRAFSQKTGVGYDAYRKFEYTGEITLKNLILCAIVLNQTDKFNELFTQNSYQSIDELLQSKKVKTRKRASGND